MSDLALAVDVQGIEPLARSLDAAAGALADTAAVDARAGAVLVSTALPITPRRTGKLADTVAATVLATGGVSLTAGGPGVAYAANVHARRPWLRESTERATDQITDLYHTHVTDVVDTIKGK